VLFLLSELNKFSELYSVLAEQLCFSQRRKKEKGIHMTENELSRHIVDVAFRIHKELGPGLLESVYEEIMYFELIKLSLQIDRQRAVSVIWDNLKMELGFRADLIVDHKVIIELKSIEIIAPVHCNY
jgi:GxxExxY protein